MVDLAILCIANILAFGGLALTIGALIAARIILKNLQKST